MTQLTWSYNGTYGHSATNGPTDSQPPYGPTCIVIHSHQRTCTSTATKYAYTHSPPNGLKHAVYTRPPNQPTYTWPLMGLNIASTHTGLHTFTPKQDYTVHTLGHQMGLTHLTHRQCTYTYCTYTWPQNEAHQPYHPWIYAVVPHLQALVANSRFSVTRLAGFVQ